MPDGLGERLARLEAIVAELARETRRSRERLHKLEGLTGMLVDDRKINDRRIEFRLQVLTVVIAVGSIGAPLIIAFAK